MKYLLTVKKKAQTSNKKTNQNHPKNYQMQKTPKPTYKPKTILPSQDYRCL